MVVENVTGRTFIKTYRAHAAARTVCVRFGESVSVRNIWCRRRDLNPHGLRHTPLKRACLPFHHFGKKRVVRRNAP